MSYETKKVSGLYPTPEPFFGSANLPKTKYGSVRERTTTNGSGQIDGTKKGFWSWVQTRNFFAYVWNQFFRVVVALAFFRIFFTVRDRFLNFEICSVDREHFTLYNDRKKGKNENVWSGK